MIRCVHAVRGTPHPQCKCDGCRPTVSNQQAASEAQPGDPCGLPVLHEGTYLWTGREYIHRFCNGMLQCWIDVRGQVPDCNCHLSPPCGACLDAPLVCDTCDNTVP